MPGNAVTSPVTTFFSDGITERRRRILRTRKARNTEKPAEAGISATATTTRSKTRHGSPKNDQRCTKMRNESSMTNIAKMIISKNFSNGPATVITGGDVSVDWELGALDLNGQSATWEAWVTVDNTSSQVTFPSPVNTASLRVYYLSGTSMPTTSANGETLYSAWRAFKLGTQTNLICNQWMNLPPAP